MATPAPAGNLIRGKFERPADPNGQWIGKSPADSNVETGRFEYSYRSIDDAVTSARAALNAWRGVSTQDRAKACTRFGEALARRRAEATALIAAELGRPRWDAEFEIDEALGIVRATLETGIARLAGLLPAREGEAMECERVRPLGVIAAISSFDAPFSVSAAQIVSAMLAGNTLVYKPSERAPLCGQLLAECALEAGWTSGQFNLVHGEREVGRRLCTHEGVDGVLFAGSNETGGRIRQDTLLQAWKPVSLQMGAKNSMVVWDDVDEAQAVRETILSAYASAGQRATSTSRVLVHRSRLESFVDRLHAAAKAFKIDHPRADPFMGPLIDAGALDRYMKFIGIATREGCEVVMRGKSLELAQAPGFYVAPSICMLESCTPEAARKSIYQQTEIFAPNLLVIGVDEVEEACELVNAVQFGLVASVLTQKESVYRKLADEIQCGAIHHNRGTLQLSPRLGVFGLRKSGNHTPGGLLQILNCISRQSLMESRDLSSQLVQPTGLQ